MYTAFGDLNKERRTPQDGPHIVVRILCSDNDKRAYILIDDVKLQRVVSNLLENAIESIQNFKTSGEILIHINVDGPILKIEIGDNGKGIPKEVFHKVGKKGYSFGKRSGEDLGLYSAIRKGQGLEWEFKD